MAVNSATLVDNHTRDATGTHALQIFILLASYLLADWASYAYTFNGLNITPWNLPAGMALYIFLRHDARYVFMIIGARVFSNELIRDLDVPVMASVLGACITSLGHLMTATAIKRWLPLGGAPLQSKALIGLMLGGLSGAMATTLLYVTLLAGFGLVPWEEFATAGFHRWVGDAIGITTLTPFLLANAGRLAAPRTLLASFSIESALQALAIAVGAWLVFSQTGEEMPLLYVVFLPMIWIAARGGLAGATTGVLATQAGMMVVVRLVSDHTNASVTSLQVLMLALAVSSLLLGAVVSDRRTAEARLRDSEGRLQAIVGSAPDAIVTFDGAGMVGSANPAAARLFGWPESAMPGQPIDRLLPALIPDQVVAAGEERTARHRDGGAIPVELTLSQSLAETRPLFVAIVRDITQRKRIEQNLIQRQEELAHLYRVSVMGQMATTLAHEMNQPLAAVVNYTRGARLLLESPKGTMDRVASTLDKAVEQAERASEVIRRVRDFIGKGRSHLGIHPVPHLFDTAIELSRGEATRNGVAVRRSIAADLPPVAVDDVQIEQVILNLMRNGIEAIALGAASLREVRLSAERHGAGHVLIVIEDTGPGIAAEIVARLFKPFTSTKTIGMGLGLSICQTIIEAHQGRLWLERSDAKGTVFHFTLPSAPQELMP